MIVVCIKNPRQSGSCYFFKNIIKIILNNYMQFLTKIRACVAVSEFQFQFPLYVVSRFSISTSERRGCAGLLLCSLKST